MLLLSFKGLKWSSCCLVTSASLDKQMEFKSPPSSTQIASVSLSLPTSIVQAKSFNRMLWRCVADIYMATICTSTHWHEWLWHSFIIRGSHIIYMRLSVFSKELQSSFVEMSKSEIHCLVSFLLSFWYEPWFIQLCGIAEVGACMLIYACKCAIYSFTL